MIKLKRAYEPAHQEDGFRVLVERLWPRGITKEAAMLDAWLKEAAPSPELRKWYSHEISKWEEFESRYRKELEDNPEAVRQVRSLLNQHQMVTFVYAAKDEQHNSALILKSFIEASD